MDLGPKSTNWQSRKAKIYIKQSLEPGHKAVRISRPNRPYYLRSYLMYLFKGVPATERRAGAESCQQ